MPQANEPFNFSELVSSGEQPDDIPSLVSFNARDGATLTFRRYSAESNVHVVLMHGSSAHSAYLYSFAKYLSDEQVANVYTPDLRGHGPSPQRRGDINYLSQLEDDLADLIDNIKMQATSGARFIIAGHSSGGGLALRFCGGQYKDLPDGLWLLAPFFGHSAPMAKKNSGGWASPNIPKIIGLSILNGFGIKQLNGAKVLKFNLPEEYQSGAETLEYSFRLMMGMHPTDYAASLTDLSVPLLLQVGVQDEALYFDKFESGVKPFKTDAEISHIEDCSHLGITLNHSAMKETASWVTENFIM